MRTPIRPALSIKPASSCVSAVCAAALVILLPAMSAAQPRAADECLSAPNAAPPAGQHWWYRTDRAANRKCWYLGPKDKNAAAQKIDREERADAPAPAEAGDSAAQPPSTQDSPAQLARGETDVQPMEQVAAESVPFLVDWSGLLKEAGIVDREDNALTRWAEDQEARAAWAMRDPSAEAPEEAGAAGEDAPAQRAEPAGAQAAGAETADGAAGLIRNLMRDLAARLNRIPLPVIAALVIAGGLGPAIFSLLRRRRRRTLHREIAVPVTAAWDGPLPSFLRTPDGASLPPDREDGEEAQQHARPRSYGGEEELRRILDNVQRRAA